MLQPFHLKFTFIVKIYGIPPQNKLKLQEFGGGGGELFKTVIIFGRDYACTPDRSVTAASGLAMMERTNFLTFHPPCIKEIYTHTQHPFCVTYWSKTKGPHTLESESLAVVCWWGTGPTRIKI